MALRVEQQVAAAMRALLEPYSVGERVQTSPDYWDLSSALERFLPDLIERCEPSWTPEAFDGVLPWFMTKTAERELEIVGQNFFIDDQTTAPLLLRVRHAADREAIEWVHCRLGLRDGGGAMERHAGSKQLAQRVAKELDGADWVIDVVLGGDQ